MRPEPLFELSATQLGALLQAGDISVEDVARSCLERIVERDRKVKAWTHLDPESVLANARELDKQDVKGPLHGIPIGIKDNILTWDMPTQYNSALYRGSHPKIDASCITILRSAGALILGKTDTVEFATNGRRALTRNPANLEHTPGGSSSGSAAAVADRHVPITIGTQTGGSIMRPASYCGTFAFKPTWGLVGRDGVRTFADSLDTVGWFGRTAEDLSLVFEVFEPDLPPIPRFEWPGAKVAVCRTPAWKQAEEATIMAMDSAVDLLRSMGTKITELALPSEFELLNELHTCIMLSEGRRSFLSEYKRHGNKLSPFLLDMAKNSQGHTYQDLIRAYDVAARCRQHFGEIASQFDAVLAPSTVGVAPRGLESTGSAIFNTIWSLLHVPCVNVPGMRDENGMPVGLTLTGPRYADRKIIAAANALEDIFKSSEPNGR